VRRALAASLLALLAAAGGCKRLQTGAREEFAKAYSCPEERVSVRARSDLKYGDLVLSSSLQQEPADEVKKDPVRLAKWESDRRKEQAELRERLNRLDVFEVKGCAHVALLGCAHPEAGDGIATDQVSCWEIPSARIPQ